MNRPLPVLIVEDCEDDALLLVRELKKGGYQPEWARVDTAEEMQQELSARKIDVILSDYAMPHFSGMDALKALKQSGLDIPFIIVSGKIGEETAVQLMKTGAHDYIVKGNLARLIPVIEREMTEAEDRSRRRQAEVAVLNAKQEWERTFDAITDPVMILDIEYRIVKANKALAEKLELTQSEAQGLYCYRVIHESHCPPENCPYTRLMSDGQSHAMEFLAPHLGGYFSASVSPIVGSDGVLQNSICIARNINEQKTLEAQLIHAQKMEAIGQLAGGIAHDFNNILTAIIGFSTLLEMEMADNDPGRENIHHVLAAADRAAELTRSLLTFSRKQVINPLPINLNDLIMNVYKFLQRILGEDFELTTSLKHDTITINADSGQIEQVLMNLATNARDAMPGGGTISIRTERVELGADFINSEGYGSAGEYALISVTDTGSGMTENTRKRLFEPFFTTKEVGKGTGLGLSIVYGIIKQHNGFITVSSTPGSGTTFMIYLPVIATSAESRGSGPQESVGAGSETILVADDDPLLRSLLEKTLAMFGYTVISAIDGQDAVQKFTEHREIISLILMDIIMPNLNGREAYEQIRIISPDVKSIFISGYSADIIHKRGMLDQELEVLAKPLSPMILLKKVREVLDRK